MSSKGMLRKRHSLDNGLLKSNNSKSMADEGTDLVELLVYSKYWRENILQMKPKQLQGHHSKDVTQNDVDNTAEFLPNKYKNNPQSMGQHLWT